MFRKFVWVFVVLPAGMVLVAFALANRHVVRLNLDPFSASDPFLALDAPFFLFLTGALLTGLLLGGFITWMGQGKWRTRARESARENVSLRGESERLEAQLRTASQPGLDSAHAAE